MLHGILSLLYWRYRIKNKENPLAILYYHHVFKHYNNYHPNDITELEFSKQIKFLKKYFKILELTEAIELLKKKQLPPKALVITFDDGYSDNFTVAAPILKKHNCPATFFIATDGIDSGVLWNDKIEQIITNTSVKQISASIIGEVLNIESPQLKVTAFQEILKKLKFLSNHDRNQQLEQLSKELGKPHFDRTMMTRKQVKQLHEQGFTIGAHTHNHTILTTETEGDAEQEISINQSTLETIVESNINFIAYPNGLYGRDFDNNHCKLVQKLNFEAGFSTNDGGAISTTNYYTIPRFMPYRKQLHLFALSIARIAGEHV